MVIHDMRNPATSIEYALKEVLKLLKLDRKKSMQKSFRKMTNSLQQIQSVEDPKIHINTDKLYISSQDVTAKVQNVPRALNLSFSNNFSQYKFLIPRGRGLEEVKEGESESNMNSRSKHLVSRNSQSEIMVTETSSMDAIPINIPLVFNANTGQKLQEQSKMPKMFIIGSNHQDYPYEQSARIRKNNQYKRPHHVLMDPSKQEVFEHTPSIYRRSFKQLSQVDLMSNDILHQRVVSNNNLPGNPFSFQHIDKVARGTDEGFDQDLFNSDSFLNRRVQQQGVVMTDAIGSELELLLKNSLFSSTMLLNLINDLLDLAKIENSTFNLNATYFNLFEIINHGLDALDFQAQQKDIRLIHQYDEEHTGFFMKIYGDKNRYLQILLNFLSNAIKFTPKGGSVVVETIVNETQDIQSPTKLESSINTKQKGHTATEQPQKSHRSRSLPDEFNMKTPQTPEDSSQHQQKYIDFEIRIQDSGYGISPENMEKLFMNFSKLEEHNSVNERGTGLGLSICKSLVELMGGSVQVQSKVGEGTTFIVKVKTKCRYVDNNEAVNLARQIEQQCRSRYSKNKDLMMFHQNLTSNINRSHLSGFHAELKMSKSNLEQMYPEEESKSGEMMINYFRSHQDGVHKFFTKNIHTGCNSPQPRKSDGLSVSNPIGKCLVANDNLFQLMMISRILQDHHFEVDEAENGLVASQKASQNDYSFIILDLDMPIMNGYEACRRIKQDTSNEIINLFIINTQRSDVINSPRRNKCPPVFALSALINEQVIEEAKKVGFDDWIEAPFDVYKLQEVILPRICLRIAKEEQYLRPAPILRLLQTNFDN